jgi:transposase
MAADGLSQREIARRLGINRRTVTRLLASEVPPRYRRAPVGSQVDRFEPVLRRLLEEWPQIKAPRATEVLRDYGYCGSVDVVRRRLRELRPASVRPAQRTGYRPGQVIQLDWRRCRRGRRSLVGSGACTRWLPACRTRARKPPSSRSI